jgi:quinoprotein glucose dehydrogenase
MRLPHLRSAAARGFTVAAAAIAVGYAALGGTAAPAEKPWTSYAGSADSSRFFDSKQITKSNVKQLQVAWTFGPGDTVFHPLMRHGTVYGRTGAGALVALDAATGKPLWVHDGMQGMTTGRAPMGATGG